jgi:hypothetical protein
MFVPFCTLDGIVYVDTNVCPFHTIDALLRYTQLALEELHPMSLHVPSQAFAANVDAGWLLSDAAHPIVIDCPALQFPESFEMAAVGGSFGIIVHTTAGVGTELPALSVAVAVMA